MSPTGVPREDLARPSARASIPTHAPSVGVVPWHEHDIVAPWRQPPRVSALALAGYGAGFVGTLVLAYGLAWWFGHGTWPGDTWTYWLAGDRVLRGHELYALAPDDWWYASRDGSPLLSPPLLAVPWLALSALPDRVGILAWLLAMAGCAVWAVAILTFRTRGWAGLAVVALALPLTLVIGVGNVDALVLAGLVGAWLLLETGHERAAGIMLAVLASLKLTPAILLVWLVIEGRWTAVRWAAITVAALAVLAAAMLGPGIFAEYLGSLPIGIGRTSSYLVVAGGVVAMVALRAHPRLTWAIAVALIPLGSPVAAIHSWSVLLAALSPVRVQAADIRSFWPPKMAAQTTR